MVTLPSPMKFDAYLNRVLRLTPYSNKTLSKDARNYVNDVLNRFLDRFCYYAITMMQHGHKKTLSSRDIQSAVRLLLVDQVARHAVSEGTKAVIKFTSHATKKGQKRVTAAKKADIMIPPSRIRRHLEQCSLNYVTELRISSTAPVYLAAVVQYLLTEFFELGGRASGSDTDKITSAHIQTAMHHDEEIARSFCSLAKAES